MAKVAAGTRGARERDTPRMAFARALVRHRADAGFQTAYGFFHKLGGEKRFGFSYRHYLRIEGGSRLPDREGMATILEAMGGPVSRREARRELLLLYLKALVDGDPLFDLAFAPAKAPPPEGGPDEEVLRRTARARLNEVPLMTAEQVDAVMSGPEAMWAHQWLMQSGRVRKLPELAKELGYPEERLQPALELLERAKLVARRKGGYASLHADTDLFAPSARLGRREVALVSERIQERLSDLRRPRSHAHFFLMSEDQETIAAIVGLCREAMRKAYLLRPARPPESGTLVGVEFLVSQLISTPE